MKFGCVFAAAVSAALFAAPPELRGDQSRDGTLCGATVLDRFELEPPSGAVLAFAAAEDDHAHDHAHSHEHEFGHLPAAFGANLFEGWLERWMHSDYSRRGTPFVHLFLSEPAYLDRDVFLDFTFMTGDEGEVYEVEVEIEYAITRRIGVVVEAPFSLLRPDDGASERGLGDIAIAPRFLLFDSERVLLSANIEVELPTGDEERGLGAGEVIVGPSLTTWVDLGCDFTFQGNIGWERGLDSHADAIVWGAAVTYSLYFGGRPEIVAADGAVRRHFPVGLLSLIAELRGEHPLDGEEEGNGTATAVLGASYTFAPQLEIRAGVMLPAWKPREFDVGGIFGIIYHF